MDTAMVSGGTGLFDWGAKLLKNGMLIVCSNHDDVELLQTYILANQDQFEKEMIAIAAKRTTVECVEALVEESVATSEKERIRTTVKLTELVAGAPWVLEFFDSAAGDELYEHLCAVQVTRREKTIAAIIEELKVCKRGDAESDFVWELMESVVTQVKTAMDMHFQRVKPCHKAAAIA
jgi:hypothetical protein